MPLAQPESEPLFQAKSRDAKRVVVADQLPKIGGNSLPALSLLIRRVASQTWMQALAILQPLEVLKAVVAFHLKLNAMLVPDPSKFEQNHSKVKNKN